MPDLFWHLSLTLVLTFSAAGYFRCRWVFRRHGRLQPDQLLDKCRHVYGLLPIPALLLMAHCYLNGRYDRQWSLPPVIELYYRPITWALLETILSYVFSLAATGFWLSRHPGRWPILTSALFMIGTIPFFAWCDHARSAPKPLTEHLTQDHIILQSHDSTCVAASAANVATLLGMPMTEREMVELCGTTEDGTSPAQLIHAMRLLGIQSRKVSVNDADFHRIQPPAIFFVDNNAHAVVFVGGIDDYAEIWDPSDGRKFISRDRLRSSWPGRAVEFRRRDQYQVPAMIVPPFRQDWSLHEAHRTGDEGRI
jgi:predicted double-glycine peptidase